MFTATFATITTFEVVFFSKHNVTFRTIIKIFSIELFVKHNDLKDKEVMPIVNYNAVQKTKNNLEWECSFNRCLG